MYTGCFKMFGGDDQRGQNTLGNAQIAFNAWEMHTTLWRHIPYKQ